MFLNDSFLVKNFVLLFVINSLYITLAQFYNLPKFFDSYWFYCFFFREAMLFCTYFAVFCVIHYIPLKWIQSIIVNLAVLLSVVLLLVNVFLAYNFGGTLNEYLVGVAFETNPNESQEFLFTYFDVWLILSYLAIILLLAFVYMRGDYIAKALIGKVAPLDSKKSLRGGGRVVWVIFIALLVLLIAIHIFRLRPPDERQSDVLYNATTSIYSAFKKVREQIRQFENLAIDFEGSIKDIGFSPIQAKDKIDTVALIIGESAQRNLMQLYGYYLPNTPNLIALRQNSPKNLLVFTDVISSQVTTSESLSQALTFANQEDLHTPWHTHLNIIDIARLAGYKTIGISNQERYSVWAKASTSIFNRNDELHWLSISSSFDGSKPDGNILPILDKSLQQNEKENMFITLHLMGNHATYYKRYPKTFDIFTQKDITSQRGAKTIAEYANATAYNDFVLSEIFKRFEKGDSIVFYFSDHGEEVFDSLNMGGHNDITISRFMLEIPFIIYVSDTFIRKHPQTYARLKAAQNTPFMNDDFIHAFIDILGFHIDGFEPHRSLFSTDFTPRKRMVGLRANKDYDAELKSQQRLP